MPRGRINLENTPFDLYKTIESGQTFMWQRTDNQTYSNVAPGKDVWYYTGFWNRGEKIGLKIRQKKKTIEWQSNKENINPILTQLLGLNDDLSLVKNTGSNIEEPLRSLFERSFRKNEGLRILRSPTFPTLISFICSSQMKIPRIHQMQSELTKRFGETIKIENKEIPVYPQPHSLKRAPLSELKQAKLGYRAPYVKKTSEQVSTQDPNLKRATDLTYNESKKLLKEYHGVGDKVADCVLLYSMGFLNAVPIDTWIRTTLERLTDLPIGTQSYDETALALQSNWGPLAGYIQTYLFYYLQENYNSPKDIVLS